MAVAHLVLCLIVTCAAEQVLPVAVITSSNTPSIVLARVLSNFEALRTAVQNEYSGLLSVRTYCEHVDLSDPSREFRFSSVIDRESIKVILEASCDPAYSRFLSYCAFSSDLLHIVMERAAELGEVPNSVFMEPSPDAQAFTRLAADFGWQHIGLFYNSEGKNQHSAAEFKKGIEALRAVVLDEALIDEQSSSTLHFVEKRLRTTKSTQTKVSFVFTDSVTAAQLLLSADENGIGGAGFAWILNSSAMHGITDIAKYSNADVATFRFGLLKTGLLGLVDADYDLLQREPIYYYTLLARMVTKAAALGVNSGAATKRYLVSTPLPGDFP